MSKTEARGNENTNGTVILSRGLAVTDSVRGLAVTELLRGLAVMELLRGLAVTE